MQAVCSLNSSDGAAGLIAEAHAKLLGERPDEVPAAIARAILESEARVVAKVTELEGRIDAWQGQATVALASIGAALGIGAVGVGKAKGWGKSTGKPAIKGEAAPAEATPRRRTGTDTPTVGSESADGRARGRKRRNHTGNKTPPPPAGRPGEATSISDHLGAALGRGGAPAADDSSWIQESPPGAGTIAAKLTHPGLQVSHREDHG